MRKYPVNRYSEELQYEGFARESATTICAHPAALRPLVIPHSTGSSILFLSPYRPRVPVTGRVTASSLSVPHIPTPFLTKIFNDQRIQHTNNKSLELFNSLSTHAMTRPTSAWHFEKRLHAYLRNNSPPLNLFSAQDSSTLQPSQQLLVCSNSVLQRCRVYPTFYWLPAAATDDFPGIDGVLADSVNVYAVQAATADERRSPADGLRKMWAKFDRVVREERAWHVVFIADSDELARECADRYAGEMEGFTLGGRS